MRATLLIAAVMMLGSTLVPGAAAEQFKSDELEPGQFWEHTFDESTTFTFHDHKNPNVEGEIMIMADSDNKTDLVTVQIRDDNDDVRFEPNELMLEVGDTVRWVNSGTQVHQVMGWTEGDEMDMEGMDQGHGHSHPHDTPHEPAAESPAVGLLWLTLAGLVACAAVRRFA